MTASVLPVPGFVLRISRRLGLCFQVRACAALLAIGVLGAPGPAHAEVRVGAVEQTQGDATAAQTGQRARKLTPGSEVLSNDTLLTGPDGRLAARLLDDTRLTLGEGAALLVDRFVYDPSGSRNRLAIRALRGAFVFVGGRVEESAGARVTVRTPLATLGIRGTTVWGGPIDGGYGVFVQAGQVVVSTSRGRVTLGPGQGTMLRPRQAPEAVKTWPAEKVQRALATVALRR
jgi:hypothetical protein